MKKKLSFALVEEVAQVKIGDGLGLGCRSGDRPTAIAAAAEERDGIVNKRTHKNYRKKHSLRLDRGLRSA